MSIIIEGMDMPKCCGSCEFNNGYRCTRTETVIDRDYEYQERLSDCPLHEGKLKEWIPVNERLPESDEDVLVTNGIGTYVGWIDPTDNGWRVDSESEYFMDDILAWMPLPEPYKTETEQLLR